MNDQAEKSVPFEKAVEEVLNATPDILRPVISTVAHELHFDDYEYALFEEENNSTAFARFLVRVAWEEADLISDDLVGLFTVQLLPNNQALFRVPPRRDWTFITREPALAYRHPQWHNTGPQERVWLGPKAFYWFTTESLFEEFLKQLFDEFRRLGYIIPEEKRPAVARTAASLAKKVLLWAVAPGGLLTLLVYLIVSGSLSQIWHNSFGADPSPQVATPTATPVIRAGAIQATQTVVPLPTSSPKDSPTSIAATEVPVPTPTINQDSVIKQRIVQTVREGNEAHKDFIENPNEVNMEKLAKYWTGTAWIKALDNAQRVWNIRGRPPKEAPWNNDPTSVVVTPTVNAELSQTETWQYRWDDGTCKEDVLREMYKLEEQPSRLPHWGILPGEWQQSTWVITDWFWDTAHSRRNC